MNAHVNDPVQTWKWTSDAFVELDRLALFGDQGWEVERVDGLARFVCHRPAAGARRWEYRRETVTAGGGAQPAGWLAADGWEPCGNWMCFEYFKRPKPDAAGLDVPPPVPSQRIFWSGRFYRMIAMLLAALLALSIAADPLLVWSGVAFGLVLAAAWVAAGRLRTRGTSGRLG